MPSTILSSADGHPDCEMSSLQQGKYSALFSHSLICIAAQSTTTPQPQRTPNPANSKNCSGDLKAMMCNTIVQTTFSRITKQPESHSFLYCLTDSEERGALTDIIKVYHGVVVDEMYDDQTVPGCLNVMTEVTMKATAGMIAKRMISGFRVLASDTMSPEKRRRPGDTMQHE